MAAAGIQEYQTEILAGVIYQVNGNPPHNAHQARLVREQGAPNVQILAADGTPTTGDILGSQVETGDKTDMTVILNDIQFAAFAFIPNYICLDAADGVTAILTGVNVVAIVDSLVASASIGLTVTANLTLVTP